MPPSPKYRSHLDVYYSKRMDSSGVYEIKCECDQSYIGMTKINLKTKIKEHIKDARTANTISDLTKHLNN